MTEEEYESLGTDVPKHVIEYATDLMDKPVKEIMFTMMSTTGWQQRVAELVLRNRNDNR